MRFRHALAALAVAGVTAAGLAGCAGPGAASVSSVKPATGDVTGHTTVTIRGDDLDSVKTVQFGSEKVAVHKGATSTKLTVTAPPAANYQPASVTVKLRSADGTRLAAEKNAYTYAAQSPVDKEMQYALAHWNNYNTAEYGNLNPVGGDCANFVSQALIARGWQMSDEWYNHDGGADWSPAWGYVPAMQNFFEDNASALGLTELSYDQRSQVAVGDIVIFDWNNNDSPDHVMIVSKVVRSGDSVDIKMVGHNDDYAYRDLGRTIQKKYPDALVTFWHFTD